MPSARESRFGAMSITRNFSSFSHLLVLRTAASASKIFSQDKKTDRKCAARQLVGVKKRSIIRSLLSCALAGC